MPNCEVCRNGQSHNVQRPGQRPEDERQALKPWLAPQLPGATGTFDVCVLAAALGAVDLGYKVIVLKDAVCSRADETRDASLELLGDRYSVQLEIITTEAFLAEV